MGKPLKAKHLNKHKRLRDQVLSRQGVAPGKSKRLGHSSHFARVEAIPIVRTPQSGQGQQGSSDQKGAGGEQKQKKSKFNKFRPPEADESRPDKSGDRSETAVNAEPHGSETAKQSSHDERMPGESYSKFLKRLNRESQEMLVKQVCRPHRAARHMCRYCSAPASTLALTPDCLCPGQEGDKGDGEAQELSQREKKAQTGASCRCLPRVRLHPLALSCSDPPSPPLWPSSARLLCPQQTPSRLLDAYQLLTLARGIEKEKQLSRKRGLHKIQQNSDEDEEAPAKSKEELEAAVRATPKFGEQAERPPIIRMNKPPKVSRFRGYGPCDARG